MTTEFTWIVVCLSLLGQSWDLDVFSMCHLMILMFPVHSYPFCLVHYRPGPLSVHFLPTFSSSTPDPVLSPLLENSKVTLGSTCIFVVVVYYFLIRLFLWTFTYQILSFALLGLSILLYDPALFFSAYSIHLKILLRVFYGECLLCSLKSLICAGF